MYNKIKHHLIEVLKSCDNHTVAILGDELYYEVDGELKIDPMVGFGSYFQDIVFDKSFKTQIDNMHLIVTPNTQ